MKIKGRFILAAAFASFHLGNAAIWSGKTRNLIDKSVQDAAITEAPLFDDRVIQDDLSEVLSTTSGKVMTREEGQLGRQLVTDSTCVSNSIAVIMGNKTSRDLLTCDTADGKHYCVPCDASKSSESEIGSQGPIQEKERQRESRPTV
jgi:hypothetical protein